MSGINITNFKRDLKRLLDRYDARLGASIEGDTHGITTNFEIEIGKKAHVVAEYDSWIDSSNL